MVDLSHVSPFVPIGILIAGIVGGSVIRLAVGYYINNPDAKLRWRPSAVILLRAQPYFLFWAVLGSAALALTFLPLNGQVLATVNRVLVGVAYSSITLFLISATAQLVRRTSERVEGFRSVAGVTERIAQIIFVIIGILLILNALGISITPLLTSLGVAGLATALALQDTLSNFFAGFYLLADHPIRPGDHIKLDTGDEGFVLAVGWRSTRMRSTANNVVIVPNQRVSHAIITNYSLLTTTVPVSLPVSVSYDSDLDKVERVLVDVATAAIGEIPGLMADPPPIARLSPGFGPTSLDFTLICQAEQFTAQFLIQHELRKRIVTRFRAEEITFPPPTWTPHVVEPATRPSVSKPATDLPGVKPA